MRASMHGAHVSGAERILSTDRFENGLTEMMQRAMSAHVAPDEIIVTIDTINPRSILYSQSLDIVTVVSSSCGEAHRVAKGLLESNGVSSGVIREALQLLQSGPAPEGANMRGAMIMDALTGKRMEPDVQRGVRVSRIDYTEEARGLLEKGLKEHGIYHGRVMDALAIATKVTHRKETVAELCWSDHPDYTTGYIASKESGYVRIPHMKERGSLRGGRVFFVKSEGLDLDRYIDYLEREPVIIDGIGKIYVHRHL